jgi:hypothetical protein
MVWCLLRLLMVGGAILLVVVDSGGVAGAADADSCSGSGLVGAGLCSGCSESGDVLLVDVLMRGLMRLHAGKSGSSACSSSGLSVLGVEGMLPGTVLNVMSLVYVLVD